MNILISKINDEVQYYAYGTGVNFISKILSINNNNVTISEMQNDIPNNFRNKLFSIFRGNPGIYPKRIVNINELS